MLTTPYVFSEESAEAMAKAGADIIVCHLGLTTGGSIGAETALTLKDCPALVDEWAEGGAEGQQGCNHPCAWRPGGHARGRRFVLKNTTNCHGFYGASSMERLPTEVALTEQTRAFKRIKGR
jgi:predicted TIM-barrel enzyme